MQERRIVDRPQKKCPAAEWQGTSVCGDEKLRFCYVSRFRAAVALLYFKVNRVAFIQAFKACLINGGIMHENIPAIIFIDKTIPFFIVEPFHFSSSQNETPPYHIATSGTPPFRSVRPRKRLFSKPK